ncbi:stress-responsive transcription factor hsf1 [Modicella reniformis]|uniref:Stress-responsive transcription factor hsf1 n=1 Tax=Modicella reniformis TaxID=1440133 RepID=A0A9P6M8P3_9FUNG|nr:stress-responsive transcription factor hsf1 [Modicella reniformis]
MTLMNDSVAAAMALVQGNNNGSINGRASNNKLSVNGGSLPSNTGGSTSAPPMQKLPRPSSTARGNVAAFLTKLYNMVSDEGSNNLIKWSDDGQSFIEFAKEVLPKFFKHNNFSSFVRQLNMYGFHKVPHLQQGVLLPDSDTEQWEFSNPHFQKNQPDLLCLVSRKKASNGSEDKDALTMDLGHILQEVTAIKKHQIAISADLKNIERDHQSLWQEAVTARERHQRQQETIDKILQFLASVFSGEKMRAINPNKKPRLTITVGEVDEEEQNDPSHGSREESEEEVTKIIGNKRKRAPIVESELGDILPGIEAQRTLNIKPTFGMNEMTPATLAMLANVTQSIQSSPAASSFSLTNSILTPTSTVSSTTTLPAPIKALPTSRSPGALPDYLTALPITTQPFKLDSANLTIPTGLLPNGISPVHHDMLRSISMANAQEGIPAPLLPSFAQTPAGANAIKGVEDIAREMEQLQRSIEALQAHGLNVENFNLDDSYLNSGAFDPGAYRDLSSICDSDIPYQYSLENEGGVLSDLIHADQDDPTFIEPAPSHEQLPIEPAAPVDTPASPPSSAPVSSTPSSSTVITPFNPATPASTVSTPSGTPSANH